MTTNNKPSIKNKILYWFQKKVIKWLNIKIQNKEQLDNQINQSYKDGIIDYETLIMLEGVFSVGDMRVRDVMIPKPSMQTIHVAATYSEIVQELKGSLHSRYPVIDENDEAIGLLYVKDLINIQSKVQLQGRGEKSFNLKKIIRQVETIPESTKLPILLNKFRSGKNHLAIVLDEHNEMVGLITIEDVLEQIVGEIRDEYDLQNIVWIVNHGEQHTVKGLTPIEVFNDYFSSDLISEGNETLAGLILEHSEKIPKQGEKITIGTFTFRILKADSRRIHLMSVIQNETSI